nr:hypothetical protein [Oceanococcus sp. HetDA_MAG_MS8]
MRLALTRRGTGRFLRIGHVRALLENLLMDDVRVLPTAGPAATLIARRSRG